MPLSVPCPGCREPLDVDEEYRAWKVRCPRCGTEFVPDEPPPSRPAPPAPRSRRRDDGDDFEFDVRPRPRRRRRRFDRDDFDDARAEVFGPAVCLEVLGWLGLLGSVGCAGFMALAGAAANQPGGPKNDDAVVFIVLGIVMGVLGLPYSLLLTIGGRSLRRLTSHGWAVAAAGAGIGGFVLFGLFGIPHLGAGIWALVVANKPHVKEAFEYQAGGGDTDDD